ncbi:MAG: PEP-CTERM sorting domain-containing protein [Nitrospinae bacterium]|nr:PEP-CTERM sorting domain-containing protein [Nitrospinota bacterium]
MKGETLMSCRKRKTENIGFRLRALFWASLVSMTLLLWMGPPHAAYAISLTNTAITGAEFAMFLGGSINSLNTTTLDVSPFFADDPMNNNFADVDVLSQTFAGAGSASGFNVYLYQVLHKSGSDAASNLTQLNIDWFTGIPTTIDLTGIGLGFVNSFYVTTAPGGGLPGGFTMVGTKDPSGSEFLPGIPATRFAFGTGPPDKSLAPSDRSFLLGLFSPQPPGLLPVNVVDGGLGSTFGTAYSPIPEPSTLWLLGIGFAGIVIYTSYRERRKGKGNSLRAHG